MIRSVIIIVIIIIIALITDQSQIRASAVELPAVHVCPQVCLQVLVLSALTTWLVSSPLCFVLLLNCPCKAFSKRSCCSLLKSTFQF